jgi:uncharacterized membrane protein YbjE (DUF340 family)
LSKGGRLNVKSSLLMLAAFLAGLLGGRWAVLPAFLAHPALVPYALCALLFLVGIGVGSDTRPWAVLRRRGLSLLLVPFAALLGTLLAVGLTSFFLPTVTLREALAVGSGCGYYTLTSVIVKELSGPPLAVVALGANFGRELLALLLAPVLARCFGPLAPVVAGGATAMDTTLPAIVEFSGKECAVVALLSGAALTVVGPLLVSLFLSL